MFQSASRSTHDFASDVPSPPESRLRLRRSACVVPVGSRSLPPPLVKGAACHDPRRLPSVEHPFSRRAAPRASLATRPGCPPLASLSLCLRARDAEGDCLSEVCNLNTDARARTAFELSALSPRRAVVRCASSGCALAGDPLGRATSIYVVTRDVPCDTPTSLYAFSRVSRPRRLLLRARPAPARGRARRVSPERCVRRRSPPLFHLAPPGSAFFTRVAERPAMTSRRATWAEACEQRRTCPRPLLKGVERDGCPSSREAPSALCHRPGCARSWSCRVRLGDLVTRSNRDPRSCRPPRRGWRSRRPGRLEPLRRSGPVKGHPFEPVDRPPPDAAPRGALPKWRASAGSAFSSRPTLNAWSGD